MTAEIRIGALLIASLLAVVGCPPAPSPSSNQNGNTNSNTNSNSAGVIPSLGPELPPAARTAVIDKVQQTLPSLNPQDKAATRTALVNLLKGTADVVAAGTSDDGSVWAIFTDGVPLVIALNDPIPMDALEAEEAAGIPQMRRNSSADAPAIAAKPEPRSQGSTSPTSIPSSNKVFLFNGFANEPAVQQHLAGMSAWFVHRGYTDASPGPAATIENLMQVKDAGALYINGHGGTGFIPVGPEGGPFTNVPIYAIGTLSRRDANGSTDSRYRDLIRSQQVGFLVVPAIFDFPPSFGPRAASRYFITRAFAHEQWSFSPGSWVYFDAAGSADEGLRTACKAQGAGLFFGWTNTPRREDTFETSQFLFSRTLGINGLFSGAHIVAEQPPQRAFYFADIWRHMATVNRRSANALPGITDTLTESNNLENPPTSPKAFFYSENLGDVSEALLVPAIANVEVDDQEGILNLFGSFGEEVGTVLVAGEPQVIEEWGPRIIRCQVDPMATGGVSVSLGSHHSDPRQLTVWRGTVSATLAGPNISTETCTLHVEFRGDVQSSRLLPGDTPRYAHNPGFYCVPQVSHVEIASESGQVSCGPNVMGTVTFSTPDPVTNLPYVILGNDEDGFYFQRSTSQSDVTGLNEVTGENEWVVVFGVNKRDAVHVDINCQNNHTTRREPLQPGSALVAHFTVGNYDISYDSSVAVGVNGEMQSVTVRLHAVNTPNDGDPR